MFQNNDVAGGSLKHHVVPFSTVEDSDRLAAVAAAVLVCSIFRMSEGDVFFILNVSH